VIDLLKYLRDYDVKRNIKKLTESHTENTGLILIEPKMKAISGGTVPFRLIDFKTRV
jgi:hypothetical protein